MAEFVDLIARLLDSPAAHTITRLMVAAGLAGSLWGLLQQRKAVQTLVALDFFKRYEAWNEHAPFELTEEHTLDALEPQKRKEVLHSIERYANLCSEEYALWRQGRVPDDIWKVWEHGIDQSFSKSLWREAWIVVRPEYNSTPDFQRFVDRISAISLTKPSPPINAGNGS